MADEDIKIGGAVVAADRATIEGEIKRVARDKVGFGAPGTYTDVNPAAPLPVSDSGVAQALADLTAVVSQNAGIDVGQLKLVRQYDGFVYPARGTFPGSVEFRGPADPALQPGLTVLDDDTWIQTT